MALKWNFQRVWRVQAKKPSVGGVWIFSGTVHSIMELLPCINRRICNANVSSMPDSRKKPATVNGDELKV